MCLTQTNFWSQNSFSFKGGDTEAVESTEDETGQSLPEEYNIDKISKVAAKVVLMVAFDVNSFDYLSVRGNLNPVGKYLKVKTRGMGKNEMAIPIVKELLRKGYVVQKDPEQRLNYNHIKRKDLERKKDLSFLFANKGSQSVSATCLPSVSEIESPCNSIDTCASTSASSASSGSPHCSVEDDSDDDKSEQEELFSCS